MSVLSYEALWNKSRIFIRRSLDARNVGDEDLFQLWAANSLELLGKAALAKVHPALVADPTSIDSLLDACGHPISGDVRSIQAKTVFERLTKLAKSFDKTAHSFCVGLATRRNAELHSGELPFHEMDPQLWVPPLWRVAKVVLNAQGRTLADWLGESEATRAEEVLSDALTALEQAIASRIEHCSSAFDQRFARGSSARKSVMERNSGGVLVAERDFGRLSPDATVARSCPACGCDGLLAGFHYEDTDEQIIPIVPEAPEEGFVKIVNAVYSAESFRCKACELALNSQPELVAGGMPEEFEIEEQRDPTWGEEYGND